MHIVAAVVVQLDNCAYTHPYSAVVPLSGDDCRREVHDHTVVVKRTGAVVGYSGENMVVVQPERRCLCSSHAAIAAEICGRQEAGSVYGEPPVALFRSRNMKLHHVL